MITLNADAGGRALFDVTFKGTLSLLPTWEDQPEAFRQDFRQRAVTVAAAALPSELLHAMDNAPPTS